MADRKQIHDFAVKWCDKFRSPNINYMELADCNMADDCDALGFKMDCGHAFSEKYGNAANNHEALDRLALLSGDNPFIFRGTLNKMQIISNNTCFGHMPEPNEEVEQHLIINNEGRVFFSGYKFGHSGEQYEKARSKNYTFHILYVD